MKLYKLWNKRRPRRIGLIPIWTGFLTLMIALLSFHYSFSSQYLGREVIFFPMTTELQEFVWESREYISWEFHDDYYFNIHQDSRTVNRSIEIGRLGSIPKNKKGWTLRHFGDRERSGVHAKRLYSMIRVMLRHQFKDHLTLWDFYKKGRIEYSTEHYNLYAIEYGGSWKYPEDVFEVWLGPIEFDEYENLKIIEVNK